MTVFLSLTSQSPTEMAQLHLYQGRHLSAISDIGTRRFPLEPVNLISLQLHGDEVLHLWKLVSKELMKIPNTFARNTRYRAQPTDPGDILQHKSDWSSLLTPS